MPVSLPPWSYTHIDTFDNCPFQYHWKYILKNKEPATKEMEEGRKTHDALEKRVAANVVLPPMYAAYEPLANSVVQMAQSSGATIRTELKVGVNRELKACDFFGKDVYGRGALDVALLSPERAPEFAWIGDWKTGKTREKDFQVKIFAFFGFITYPTLKRVSACNIWLPTKKPGEAYKFFREDMPTIWAEIYIKLSAMEMAAASDNWVKRQSPLCAWCPVKDCEFNRKKG
jgi:hypothetical protein